MVLCGFSFSLIIVLNSILYTEQYIEKKHIQILKNYSICATFNGESAVYGCQSNENGNSGTVIELSDIKDIIQFSKSLYNFILMVPYDVFSKLKAEDLQMNKLVGLLVKSEKGSLQYDSPESTISTNKTIWNSKGSNLISKEIHIPIFLLKSEEEVNKIKECITKYKDLCHVSMKSFMYSAGLKNGLCHRRTIQNSLFQDTTFCQPLTGYSIWASINDFTKRSRQPKSVIIVLSRIDSRSIFYQESLSAESVASALSIIMTSSKQLTEIMSKKQYSTDKTFIFLLLNGESWDNIGSTTFIKDLILNKFPDSDNNLTMEEIDMVVQIDQSALMDSSYYGHLSQTYDENAKNKPNNRHIKEFAEAFNKSLISFSSSRYSFHFQKSFGLPTFNSLSPFESKDLPVILLSDYYDTFKNKFFHSFFDNNEYIQFTKELCLTTHCETTKKLAIIASSLTYTLFKMAHPDSTVEPEALIPTMPNDLIRDHLECMLITKNCQLFKSIFNTTFNNETSSNHIGTTDGYTPYTYNLMAQLASSVGQQTILKNNQTCNKTNLKEQIVYLNKNICFKMSGSYFQSISPLISSKQAELDILKDLKIPASSWHESIWNEHELLLYRINEEYYEIFFFIMSLVVFMVNLFIIYLMNKKQLI